MKQLFEHDFQLAASMGAFLLSISNRITYTIILNCFPMSTDHTIATITIIDTVIVCIHIIYLVYNQKNNYEQIPEV